MSGTLVLTLPTLSVSTSNITERDNVTAGHESSLGDDNRDNVEQGRRHEAPSIEGMTVTPNNGFKACSLLGHFRNLLLVVNVVVSAGSVMYIFTAVKSTTENAK